MKNIFLTYYNQQQNVSALKKSTQQLCLFFALFFMQHTFGFFTPTSIIHTAAQAIRKTKQISQDVMIISGCTAIIYITIKYNPFNLSCFKQDSRQQDDHRAVHKALEDLQVLYNEQIHNHEEHQAIVEEQLRYCSEEIANLTDLTTSTRKEIQAMHNKIHCEDHLANLIQKTSKKNHLGQNNIKTQLTSLQYMTQTIQKNMHTGLEHAHKTQKENTAYLMRVLEPIMQLSKAITYSQKQGVPIEPAQQPRRSFFENWSLTRPLRSLLQSPAQDSQSMTNK
jgi:hypothetical protein